MTFEDYERYVIKALLLWPVRALPLAADLTLDCFAGVACREIYRAVRNLEAAGSPISVLQVAAELERYDVEMRGERADAFLTARSIAMPTLVVLEAPAGRVVYHEPDDGIGPSTWMWAFDERLFAQALVAVRTVSGQRGELERARRRTERTA